MLHGKQLLMENSVVILVYLISIAGTKNNYHQHSGIFLLSFSLYFKCRIYVKSFISLLPLLKPFDKTPLDIFFLFRDAMYGRMESVCPFFAFYSLTDIAEEFLPNAILDVHIDSKSMNTFKNVVGPQSEQFYWPSSSSFSLKCVSEASCVDLGMLGIQRQVGGNYSLILKNN